MADQKKKQNVPDQANQAFLLELNDAIRPLTDASEIQQTASRLVGKHLQVDRVLYAEIEGSGPGAEAVIRGQFVQNGAFPIPERISYAAVSQGHVAECFRQGLPFVVNDAQTDPRFDEDVRAAWLGMGGRSVISLSLIKDGVEKIIFGLHYSKARVWTEAEIALMADVAERTWAAAERARIETALQKSEEKYRMLFEVMAQGYQENEIIRNEEGKAIDHRVIASNPQIERLTGIPLEVALTHTAKEIFPDLEPFWLEFFDNIVRTGKPERLEREYGPLKKWYELSI